MSAGFSVRPADVLGMGLRWEYDDGRGLRLHGFAGSERRALRDMRRYRKQNEVLLARLRSSGDDRRALRWRTTNTSLCVPCPKCDVPVGVPCQEGVYTVVAHQERTDAIQSPARPISGDAGASEEGT